MFKHVSLCTRASKSKLTSTATLAAAFHAYVCTATGCLFGVCTHTQEQSNNASPPFGITVSLGQRTPAKKWLGRLPLGYHGAAPYEKAACGAPRGYFSRHVNTRILQRYSNEVLFFPRHDAMLHAGMRATLHGHKWCVACWIRRGQPRCLAPCTEFAVRHKQGFCSLHWIFPPGQKAANRGAAPAAQVINMVAIWAPASCSSARWVLACALLTPSARSRPGTECVPPRLPRR